ncbi:hypothetical protein ACHAXA_000690 [Cyclostephanos tholiformis]|uniref:3-hydroxyisobutyryl-CoA hydrolase n=1 Tax=Cyclostephanos tholiformis TaxID=382380 RepID=A0ABD3R1S7_9STRA
MSTNAAYRRAAAKINPRLSPTSLTKIANEMEMSMLPPNVPRSVYDIPQSVRTNPFVLRDATTGKSTHPYHGEGGGRWGGDDDIAMKNPGAVVRSIGTSRRVFLLDSSLTPGEIDGLAYRVRVMSNNDAINSVLIGNPIEDAMTDGDMSDNPTVLPGFMEEDDPGRRFDPPGGAYRGRPDFVRSVLHEGYGEGLGVPIVACGYDARDVYDSGMSSDRGRLDEYLLSPLTRLSDAIRGVGRHDDVVVGGGGGGGGGGIRTSKVPVISLPHGLVMDSGYALLLGSYVLATHSTSFRILNPLRGLSFDPIGLTYLLPRVGREFRQPSAYHSVAIASMMALSGYEADARDMVATGLATHYVGGQYKTNLLERALMDVNSYEYQSLHPKPTGLYGREDDWRGVEDINVHFRNVAVANLIQHVSEYDAAGADEYGVHLGDMLDDETGLYLRDNDPSINLPGERIQMYGELESDLVNYAATFVDAFDEPTVPGILERLREIASTRSTYEGKLGYEEDVEVADVAHSLVTGMEKRSPLALCVSNRLLRMGAEEDETMESCMERERRSQANLFTRAGGDYARWARSGCGVGLVGMPFGSSSLIKEREDVFNDWVHGNVGEVTEDEVDEIIG